MDLNMDVRWQMVTCKRCVRTYQCTPADSTTTGGRKTHRNQARTRACASPACCGFLATTRTLRPSG